MKSRFTLLLIWTVSVLCLTACGRQAVEQADTEVARGQIQQLLDTYFQSVKAADVTLASTIWLQSPDIVVVTPLGRFQGWDAVQKDLYVNFLQKAFLERDLKPGNVHIQVNGNSAWAVFDWSFTAKLANGQPFASKGWESHVYQKTDSGWRIAHLHYSGQPPQSQQ
jgi:ketosteroid isomerase-like protein